ncbi:MAG: HTH-type transcriptional repressor FabR [Candidatus Binatia bacterium]
MERKIPTAISPGLREERKQRTRQALLDAALDLLQGEHSFASLSLREVTRAAGIVPTAFYRHFDDMDELGLALVEKSFRTLRQLMRAARSAPLPTQQLIRRSVETFVTHVRANRRHFQFVARERAGGRSAVRGAIHAEIRLFVSELATDLGRFPALGQWRTEDLQMMAGLLVAAMVNGMLDILDLPASRPDDERELIHTLEKQLRLVVLGASQWKSG